MFSPLHVLAIAMYFGQMALVFVGWWCAARLSAFHPALLAVRLGLLAGGLVVWALLTPVALPPLVVVGQLLGWVALPAGLGDWMAYALQARAAVRTRATSIAAGTAAVVALQSEARDAR